MLRTEQLARCPIAETNSGGDEAVAHPGECEDAQNSDGCQFEELTATLAFEFLVFESCDHFFPSVGTGLGPCCCMRRRGKPRLYGKSEQAFEDMGCEGLH